MVWRDEWDFGKLYLIFGTENVYLSKQKSGNSTLPTCLLKLLFVFWWAPVRLSTLLSEHLICTLDSACILAPVGTASQSQIGRKQFWLASLHSVRPLSLTGSKERILKMTHEGFYIVETTSEKITENNDTKHFTTASAEYQSLCLVL